MDKFINGELTLNPSRVETAGPRTAYQKRIHRDQYNLIPLDPEAFIQKALALLASDRYLEKGMGLMALTAHRLGIRRFAPLESLLVLAQYNLIVPDQNIGSLDRTLESELESSGT